MQDTEPVFPGLGEEFPVKGRGLGDGEQVFRHDGRDRVFVPGAITVRHDQGVARIHGTGKEGGFR